MQPLSPDQALKAAFGCFAMAAVLFPLNQSVAGELGMIGATVAAYAQIAKRPGSRRVLPLSGHTGSVSVAVGTVTLAAQGRVVVSGTAA
jgi:hypothetical protein